MNQEPFLTTENTEDTDKACFVLFCLQSRSVLSVVKLFCFSPVLEKSLILSPGILAVLCILTLSTSGQELILEPRFSVHFEGELLERVEDLLRYQPEPEDRASVPSEAPAED